MPLAYAAELRQGAAPALEPLNISRIALPQVAGHWLKVVLPASPGATSEIATPKVLVFENLRRLRVHLLHADHIAVHDMLEADPVDPFGRGQLYVPVTPEQQQAAALWVWIPPEMAHTNTPLGLQLLTIGQAQRQALQHARVVMAIVASLAVLALLTSLLWLVVRGRALMLYSMYVATSSLYVLYVTGEGFTMMPFAQLAPLGSGTWVITGTIGFVSANLFFCELVKLRLRMPLTYKLVNGLVAATITCVLSSLFLTGTGQLIAITAANLVDALVCLLVLVTATRLAIGGTRHAQVFLGGWVIMCGFVTLRTWELAAGHVPTSWATYGMPASMLAAAVLMVVALADALMEERRALARARVAAEQDALTGVRNRASIESFLLAALSAAQRDEKPLSLLFMDLDHFKQINDSHGHAGGDVCLRFFAHVVQAELTNRDALGRIGGEEFIAVLRDTPLAAAGELAERVRQAVSRVPVVCEQGDVALRVSIGVASVPPLAASVAGLLAAADKALYRAKAEGRDRVSVHMGTAPDRTLERAQERRQDPSHGLSLNPTTTPTEHHHAN